MNWLAFLFQIFVQIVRGTPSMTQLFDNIGFSHAGQASFLAPPTSTSSFKPLPVVEIPLHSSSNTAVDVKSTGDDAEGGNSAAIPFGKLTVCIIYSFMVLITNFN